MQKKAFGWFTKPYNKYGELANTVDALKAFAIITMTLDHLAYFGLSPTWLYEELRLIGRFSFPVWMFLVGYSRSTRISLPIIIFGCLLQGLEYSLIGKWDKPNILISIIVARLALKYFPDKWWHNMPFIGGSIVVGVLLYNLTKSLFDYGTLTIVFCMLGRLQRENKRYYIKAAVMLLPSYIYLMHIGFSFSPLYTSILTVGMVVLLWVLYRFRQQTISVSYPSRVHAVLKICGRYTLHYYVMHMALLMLLAIVIPK